MLGSEYRQYQRRDGAQLSLFPIEVKGRTVWGWRLRAEDGRVKGQSFGLFQNYVACLCDALRRADIL
jgi:hypothetical protein